MNIFTRKPILFVTALLFIVGLVLMPLATIGLLICGLLLTGVMSIIYSAFSIFFRKPLLVVAVVIGGYVFAVVANAQTHYFLFIILMAPFFIFHLVFGGGDYRNNAVHDSGYDTFENRDKYNPGGLGDMVDSNDFLTYGVDSVDSDD